MFSSSRVFFILILSIVVSCGGENDPIASIATDGSAAGQTDDAGVANDVPIDTGVAPNPTIIFSDACAELLECCATLPRGGDRCQSVAEAGDPGACSAGFAEIQSLGGCGGMRPDVGPRDGGRDRDASMGDGAALGASCSALLDCCRDAPGQLGQSCRAAAAAGDEAACEISLGRAFDAGRCLATDAGASIDAGS